MDAVDSRVIMKRAVRSHEDAIAATTSCAEHRGRSTRSETAQNSSNSTEKQPTASPDGDDARRWREGNVATRDHEPSRPRRALRCGTGGARRPAVDIRRFRPLEHDPHHYHASGAHTRRRSRLSHNQEAARRRPGARVVMNRRRRSPPYPWMGVTRALDTLSGPSSHLARTCATPARSIAGPNGPKLDKETTLMEVRWTQVDGVTLHDGTPRSHLLEGGVFISLIEF
jgi:hypothetical protein